MTLELVERHLRVPANHLMYELLGREDVFLRAVDSAFPEVRMVARGNEISFAGPVGGVSEAEEVFEEMLILVQEGQSLSPSSVEQVIQMVRDKVPSPSGVLSDGLQVGRGRIVRPKTRGQATYIEAIRENTLTFGIGPAGTGKTYLAMAAAVEGFLTGSVRRILLTRPAVEAGERLGYLPGDLTQKIDPYLRPLYDALWDMLGPEETGKLMEKGTIEIAPLAYMRGRTLNDCCVILDEAQNTSQEQMKMFLTRLGFNSKMIITGDITQTDLPSQKESGLSIVRRVLKGIPGVTFCELTSKDVVRHRIVAAIVEAYQRYDATGERK